MEATVEKLEAMFNKADSDLDFLHRKLENECGAYCESEEGNQVNPVQLVDRISEIKGEYQNIMEDAKEIQKAQMDAMMFFRDNLSNACSALMKLQMNSGLGVDKPEELIKLEETLGLSISEPSQEANSKFSVKEQRSSQSDTEGGAAESKVLTTSGKINATSAPKKDQRGSEVSPSALRQHSDEFLEVTNKEFETVSSLIRGRVKRSEVNQAYQVIWQHYKENPESDPLTPADMHKMGLKVTGKTGDAKLKVLRALKLLHIAKNGNVKLP